MIPTTIMNPWFLASTSSGTVEVDNWKARIIAAGSTVSDSTVAKVRTFVAGCKTARIWDSLLDIGVFAGNDLTAALVKLKYQPTVQSTISNMVGAVNGTNYVESAGYIPTISYKYLDSGVRLDYISADGTNLHLAMYCKDAFNLRPMGVFRSSVATRHYLVYNDYSTTPSFAWGTFGTGGSGTTAGFRITTHYSGSNAYLYLNGTSVESVALDYSKPSEWSCGIGVSHGSATGSSAEAGSYFGATATAFQYYSIGYGLSASQAATYNTLVHALQVALGRS
jgi:hypothetical protein